MKFPKLIKAKLLLQTSISFLVFPWLYFLLWLALFYKQNYKVFDLQGTRKKFQQILNATSDPLLICANHLTYVDSILMTLICCPWWRYWLNFKLVPWNFPKTTHIKNNFLYKVITYLGKCISLNLEGSKAEVTQTIKIASALLANQEHLILFPEGHRSITGRVDKVDFAYGVGKLIKCVPNTKVICIYLRSDQQGVASNFPPAGSKFYIEFSLLDPWQDLPENVLHSDLKTIKNIAKNIVWRLAAMENTYFNQFTTMHV